MLNLKEAWKLIEKQQKKDDENFSDLFNTLLSNAVKEGKQSFLIPISCWWDLDVICNKIMDNGYKQLELTSQNHIKVIIPKKE